MSFPRDGKKEPLLLRNYHRPPVFCGSDFRPLAYSSIWFFNPSEVRDCIRRNPLWRDFCLESKPNYFNVLVTMLTIVAAMVDTRNQRKKKWAGQGVCFLAREFALKPNEGGQFILLRNFLTGERSGEIIPSVIPLILPQAILAETKDDGSKIVLESINSKITGR